jgi:hypothetical protein
MSSTYGNSAMASAMFSTIGLTILTNRSSRVGRIVATVALGFAILIRADAVLLVPVAMLLRWHERRSVGDVIGTFGPLIVGLAMTYGLLFGFDNRMTGAVRDVTSHLTNQHFETHFWDYLLWSTSPVLFFLAAFGLRELCIGRRDIVAAVIVWCVPLFAFYYSATTTPRYFVSTVMPIAVCSACALVAAVKLFPYPRLAAVLGGLAASAQLLVNLGYYTPGDFRHRLDEGSIQTHIGPLWTGAFLYHSYVTPSLFFNSIRNPGFHRTNPVQRSLDQLLDEVAQGRYRGRTIMAVLNGGNGHVFHYYAQLHGARYEPRKPGPVFNRETWLELGGSKLMSIGRPGGQFDSLPSVPLQPGDMVWLVNPGPDGEAMLRAKTPNLDLTPMPDTTPRVRRYLVASAP